MDIFLISLITLIVILSYGIINLLLKIEKVEGELDETIANTRNKVRKSLLRMREIDYNGSFESDDEVGQIFKDLKRVIEDLENGI
jgi:hypothetical protein